MTEYVGPEILVKYVFVKIAVFVIFSFALRQELILDPSYTVYVAVIVKYCPKFQVAFVLVLITDALEIPTGSAHVSRLAI